MPFAVYGGIVAEGADVARRLLDVAIERTRERGHSYLELRHYAPYDCAELGIELEPNDRYVTFVRELPDDPEACLTAIPRKAAGSGSEIPPEREIRSEISVPTLRMLETFIGIGSR